jgi:transposase InsO family protein
MSDNGPAYLLRRFAKACAVLGLKHIRTRPYAPYTNGKAALFIQTLCKEWVYAMAFANSQERDLCCRVTSRSIAGSESTQSWAAAPRAAEGINVVRHNS